MSLFHESIDYPKLIKIEFFKISGLVKGYTSQWVDAQILA